jgi:hypothetical protein
MAVDLENMDEETRQDFMILHTLNEEGDGGQLPGEKIIFKLINLRFPEYAMSPETFVKAMDRLIENGHIKKGVIH